MANRIHGAMISARYSTDNQNPDSIEVQVAKCTSWCHENNIPILGVYADEATSGMKDTRPQYEAMMAQLRNGVGDVVVIYDQSRMFRKMTAWFTFRDQLAALGVEVVCVTQPMIGKDLRDPAHFLTEGSMALFNQIWSLQSRQKTMEKMRHMARNGQYTGGVPALGYKVANGRLEINEDEAQIVRRIFREYADGASYRDIMLGLNADGIKTKRGNSFGSNSLHGILKNEKYVGDLTYGRHPRRASGTRNSHEDAADYIRVTDAIPRIIDRGTFERVQQRLIANQRQQSGRPATIREYPLKGKVFCAKCKSALVVNRSKGAYDYYVCGQKLRQHTCDLKPISVIALEQTVVAAVRQVLGAPSNVDKLLKVLNDQAGIIQGHATEQLQRLITEDGEIRRKLSNATDAVLEGLSSKALQAKIQQLEQRQIEVTQEMLKLRRMVDATAIPECKLRSMLELLTTSSAGDAAVLSIVRRVEVDDDKVMIWTILDNDPDGTYTWDAPGVLITPGVGSAAPNQYDPNQIFLIGDGFGLFVYFEKFEETYFKNGIIKRPNAKPRGPRKKKLT